ncbi:MAG: acetolactate synthase large subunit, partial [Mycobacterium sp.]|nr:acetolactate synthase large subunit [Mycobacterium sp.]
MSAPATRAPQPSAGHAPTNGAQQSTSDSASDSATPPRPATVPPQQITGAEAVVRSLEELGVELIFGIPGGAVLPVYDPLFDSQQVRHVLVRHEQGAGHA